MKLLFSSLHIVSTQILAFSALLLSFHLRTEASGTEELRILVVGIRGQSRSSAVDILSGRKDNDLEHTQVLKTPVITHDGRRMIVITGPNLCEETESEAFTSALFLSSPGPHAVLMALNPEDQEPEQCEILKRARERLGDKFLQYCIVLLHKTGLSDPSREIIDACRGRFLIMSDSDPKLLVAEIDKLVWLNGAEFYSPLNESQLLQSEKLQLLKRLDEIEKKLNVGRHFSSGGGTSGAVGLVGWSLLVSLTAVVLGTRHWAALLLLQASLAGLVVLMSSIRTALGPHVALALNLPVCSSITAAFVKALPLVSVSSWRVQTEFYVVVGVGVTLGSMASVRSVRCLLLACCAGVGVAAGTYTFISQSFDLKKLGRREVFLFLMFSSIGAELVLCCVVLPVAVFGTTLSVIFWVMVVALAPQHLQPGLQTAVIQLIPALLLFPCFCALLGSALLLLDLLWAYFQVVLELFLGSYWFYGALFGTLLIVIGQAIC